MSLYCRFNIDESLDDVYREKRIGISIKFPLQKFLIRRFVKI